jgi:hypothetical protein
MSNDIEVFFIGWMAGILLFAIMITIINEKFLK